jgi:hypothetical protein
VAGKKSSNKLPPFVALTWEMLNSKAYIDLPPSAAKVLPYFLGKPKFGYGDPQRYREEFHLSYAEASSYGFAIATHHRNISQLVEKGFIDPVDKGGLRGLGRSYSLFTISWRWKEYGKSDFQKISWRCFQPRERDRSRARAKMKTYNGRNGNKEQFKPEDISRNDVVEAIQQ